MTKPRFVFIADREYVTVMTGGEDLHEAADFIRRHVLLPDYLVYWRTHKRLDGHGSVWQFSATPLERLNDEQTVGGKIPWPR